MENNQIVITPKRFAALDITNAPGEHVDDAHPMPSGVDFTHGNVDAFPPVPGAAAAITAAIAKGAPSAYSRYRGHWEVREPLAERLAVFTGQPIDPSRELMITPGTQAGLFLALSALVESGTRTMVVEPDYFANRRLVRYLGGQLVPLPLRYEAAGQAACLDLDLMRAEARGGAKVIVFSNPNNPTGVLYSAEQLSGIAAIANEFGVTVVADELYSRLTFAGHKALHLRDCGISPDLCITLLGPSKSESLSGFRVGAAVGASAVIDRMEQLLGVVSLRTAGYNQLVLHTWFNEPDGWFQERVNAHQSIRDDLVREFEAGGFAVRPTEGGSYLFPRLPQMRLSPAAFVRQLRREEGVVVTPGHEFGPTHPDSIRLNFSQHHSDAVKAVRTIVEAAGVLAA